MTTEELVKLFIKVGVRDHDGYIMMKTTADRNGIKYGGGTFTKMTRFIKQHPEYAVHFRVGRGYTGSAGGLQSMPFGPRAKTLPFEELKKPWVYEVVCRGSGRRYIGTSKKPYMRRAVHLFYLRNLDLETTSNVFFGNDKVAEDVALYGVDSFYMDVLEPETKNTRGSMSPTEQKWLDYYGWEQLYNLPRRPSVGDVQAEVAAAFKREMNRARADLEIIKREYDNVRERFGRVRLQVISPGLDTVIRKRLETQLDVLRGERDEVKRKYLRKQAEIAQIREKRRTTRVVKVGTGRTRTVEVVTI